MLFLSNFDPFVRQDACFPIPERKTLLEVSQEPGTYNLSISLPGLAPQNLRICVLENGLIVKSSNREVRSVPHKQSANESRGMFYWRPLPTDADVPGIVAELKHNRLEIKIPIILEPQPLETEARGKESADFKKTEAA